MTQAWTIAIVTTGAQTSFGGAETQISSPTTSPFWDLELRVDGSAYLNQSTLSCSAPAGNTINTAANA